MAGDAILPQVALVGVILGVAGKAGRGRAFENIVDVALQAGDRRMLPRQGKCRLAVIDTGELPAIQRVALAAVAAHVAMMDVIFGVAGTASLRGGLQGRQVAGARVALAAGGRRMFTGQAEGDPGVVKDAPVGIDAIVAGQAVRPKILEVSSYKSCIQAGMAGGAHRLVKCASAVTGLVAIRALKCAPIRHFGVHPQAVSQLLVLDIPGGGRHSQ